MAATSGGADDAHFHTRQSGSRRRHRGQDQDAGRVELRFARWDSPSQRGTVCVFGGRGEFIEKYFETITELRRRGFAVATMDGAGKGIPPGNCRIRARAMSKTFRSTRSTSRRS